jgi:hypothetical protein
MRLSLALLFSFASTLLALSAGIARSQETLTAHAVNRLGVTADLHDFSVVYTGGNAYYAVDAFALALCGRHSFCLEIAPDAYIAIPFSSLKEARLADGRDTVVLTNGKTLAGRLLGTLAEESRDSDGRSYDLKSVTSLTLTGGQRYQPTPAKSGERNWQVLGTQPDFSTLSLKRPRFAFDNTHNIYKPHGISVRSTSAFEIQVEQDRINASIDDFSEIDLAFNADRNYQSEITVTSFSGVKTVGWLILNTINYPGTGFALVADIDGLANSTLILRNPNCALKTTKSESRQQATDPQTAAVQKQAAAKSTPSQLKLTVNTITVATKFLAYVGGGTNISPPDTIGGGDGIPLISISNGASFLAGEVSSKDEKTKLIKITITVTNSGQEAASFKIGDVLLVVGAGRLNDFAAVGYGSKLCAMSDADRKVVKETVVTVPPAGTRVFSFAFPLLNPDSKRGELVLGSLSPVPFEIPGSPGK